MKPTPSSSTKRLPSGAMMGPQQMEWLVREIERGLATRSHAKMLREIAQDLSDPLYRAIASGTAGLREAAQVRSLLGLKR